VVKEPSSSGAASSRTIGGGSGGGGGGGDMMSQMIAQRNKVLGSVPKKQSPSVVTPSSASPSSAKSSFGNKDNDSAKTTVKAPTAPPTPTISLKASPPVSSSNGNNAASISNAELNLLKEEILAEVRSQIQQMKEEILAAIRG